MKADDIWQKIVGEEVFFIAEIGKNFIQVEDEKTVEEYVSNAKKLIDKAKEAGADAVKFQTHRGEDEQMPVKVMSPHFKGEDRYSWVMRNSKITPDWFWQELKNYCEQVGIVFFSAPMSRAAAQVLESVNVQLWKVGSGDILDFVMLDYIRKSGKPIIISSGMSKIEELDQALRFIRAQNKRVALLHCVSKYPCPKEEVKAGVVRFFRNRYDMPGGFSDHSIGFGTVKQAVGCGATVVEKHFSINRDLWGSDHKVSMTPGEYAEMVREVRGKVDVVEDKEIIGSDEIEELPDSDSVFRDYFRKSLVASEDIRQGERISRDSIYAMRPQAFIDGLPSERYEDVVGAVAMCDIKKGRPIQEHMIELRAKERVK